MGAEIVGRPSASRGSAAALAVCLVGLAGVDGCESGQPPTPLRSVSTTTYGDAAASGCKAQPGDVAVLKGGTFPVDAEGTIRAGLQYEVSQNPRTWKVMFLADGAATDRDVKRDDTVSVAGQTITVRDACADKVVLTLVGGVKATNGPTSTG